MKPCHSVLCLCAPVVVDMVDETSIDLAGAWKQDFVNRASCSHLVSDLGNQNPAREEGFSCDVRSIPVLLLGNKYDLVSMEE